MGGRARSATPKHADTAPGTEHADNPGLRLLDALRAGDEAGVLAVCGPATTVSAENMAWSCRGREQIRAALDDARALFPGVTFESRTRQVGFGVVIEEARVRDVQPEAASVDLESEFHADAEPDERSDHPMYDDPTFDGNPAYVVAPARPLTEWRDAGEAPAPLDLPVRVIVRHDDLQVHEVAFSFPAALLNRALGLPVDPFELSSSEVQSAFLAPIGAEPVTRDLARPDPVLGAGTPVAAQLEPSVVDDRSPRRRGRWVMVLVALLALVAAGAWWAVQGRGGDREADPATSNSVASTPPSTSPSLTPSPTPSPSASVPASRAPTVTHARPSETPARTPNVTLRSDLAFGFNSARLSAEAKTAIDQVARQVVRAAPHGRIFVDGYTDSTGSAAYGVVLSRQRADAVSTYLQSQLLGAPVSIVSTGHGEAHPVADNATASGRKANRRVTITLPRP